MWSPEGRKENAAELRRVADKILRYRQLTDRFASYFQGESDNARQLRERPEMVGNIGLYLDPDLVGAIVTGIQSTAQVAH